MSERKYKFRLQGEYKGAERDIAGLTYEVMTEQGWQPYDPQNYKAGFLIFLYALFNCQQVHFRVGTAERGLRVSKVSGQLDAEAGENWELSRFDVHMEGQLIFGDPSEDDIAYIIDHMRHCPASVNVKFTGTRTTIAFT